MAGVQGLKLKLSGSHGMTMTVAWLFLCVS